MNDYDIKQMYEEMENYLIDSMKRNLGRHLLEEEETGFQYTQWQAEKLKELKRYQKENKEIVGRYTLGLDEKVSEHLQNELKQGSINAIKQYNKAIPSDKLKPSEVMNKSFFRTNDKKVNALIKTVNNDLKVANASALRMTNDQYRQIIHKSAMFVSNGVLTEKQATAQAVKEIKEKKLTTLAVDEASKNFLAGGLNCIVYKDGRRVNIASYAQMAIRTASLRAQLMAEGNLRAQKGLSLVQVTSHGGSCKYCSGWENKVLVDDVYSGGKPDGKHKLLSEAMAQGFLHPNCRHGVTTYFPELEDDYEDEEETETQDTEVENIEKTGISEEEKEEIVRQLNSIIRNIKKYKRLERGSLDESNIKKYSLMKKSWQKRIPKEYIDVSDKKVVKYKIDEYEKIIVNKSVENAYVISSSGEVFNFIGNNYSIEIPEWLNLANSVITHNHPIRETNYSLSEDDIRLFLSKNVKLLRGIDDKYIYYVKRTKDTITDTNFLKQDIKEIQFELLTLASSGKIDIDEDGYDYINKKLSKKYKFIYIRRLRK